MEKLIPSDEMSKYLTAFADGELRSAESTEVLEYLAANPQAMARIVGQQRLRLAAERAVRASTPPVPDLLRQRVAAAAAAAAAPVVSQARDRTDPAPRRRLASSMKLLLPVVAAACVAVGVSVGRWSSPKPVGDVGPLAVAITAQVTRVHVDCSRHADHLHEPAFPREVRELPAALLTHLGAAAPYPDLSAMGYEFAGAGPCELPGAKTVHLLYRPRRADMADTVSVFLQADAGQVGVEPDTVYVASPPDAPHPLLLWRSAGVVYYLVADDAGTANAALAAIPTAPKTRKA